MKTRFTLTLAAVVVAALGGAAWAAQHAEENDGLAALKLAKFTLVQAVGVAEAHAGGTATRAELESERGAVVFSIEIVTPDHKVLDVTVDAIEGKVLASRLDRADEHEREDERD